MNIKRGSMRNDADELAGVNVNVYCELAQYTQANNLPRFDWLIDGGLMAPTFNSYNGARRWAEKRNMKNKDL